MVKVENRAKGGKEGKAHKDNEEERQNKGPIPLMNSRISSQHEEALVRGGRVDVKKLVGKGVVGRLLLGSAKDE